MEDMETTEPDSTTVNSATKQDEVASCELATTMRCLESVVNLYKNNHTVVIM